MRERSSVVVYSDNCIIRKGLISSLSSKKDIQVVGEASTRIELLECMDAVKPDVVLMYFNNSSRDRCAEVIELANRKSPETKVLLLVEDYDDKRDLEALKLGVKGVIAEADVDEYVAKAIRSIQRGELWVRRRVLAKLVKQLLLFNTVVEGGRSKKSPLPSFTKKELEVIMLVGKGFSNKEIGKRLYISEKTVKNHLSKIFKKLRIKKRTEIRPYLS